MLNFCLQFSFNDHEILKSNEPIFDILVLITVKIVQVSTIIRKHYSIPSPINSIQ